MASTRHHDIELPAAGGAERVPTAFPTVFTWDYRTRHEELLRLYEKGKTLQWNATTDIDWSIDVDPERVEPDELTIIDGILALPEKLDLGKRRQLEHHWNAWLLSQFLHGEQGALLATAEIVNTVPWTEIVPNLKRLGLLTPRVRQQFADLGILEFESLPDSTVEAETAMPPALMTFFMRLQAAGIELPALATSA